MERKSYNQYKWLASDRRREHCPLCRGRVIWMKTLHGNKIAVEPMKVIERRPGIQVLGEDGIIMRDIDPKIGWRLHECKRSVASGAEANRAAYEG